MNATSTKISCSPEECLREYVQGGRSEVVFTRLVNLLGGLSFQTAFHITGDRGLAEEASQGVFMILERKAKSLLIHSSLSAWIHRTSRYEADKILKRERSHRRRLEKYCAENMNEVENAEVLSRENWRLLDESVDRLNSKDRALVLARFFEGKKFREIAAETGSSEAACKVRLRRVMDQMAGWLKGRGCTLSVTAMASFLGAEWARACPSNLLSAASGISSGAVSSSVYPISKILTAMKISKMTATGVLLLIGAVFVPSFMKENSFLRSVSSDLGVMLSGRTHAENSHRNDVEVGGFLGEYRFAHDRLEELYGKYPNLCPREKFLASGTNLVEQQDLLYKENKRRFREGIPEGIWLQMRGLAEWDNELVWGFLEDRRDLIDGILMASEYSVLPRKLRYSFSDEKPGLVSITVTSQLLALDFMQNFRVGESGHAKSAMTALLRTAEAGSFLNFAPSRVGASLRGVAGGYLSHLAESGYDVSRYVGEMTRVKEADFLVDGMLHDFAETISAFEKAKEVSGGDVSERMGLVRDLDAYLGVGNENNTFDQRKDFYEAVLVGAKPMALAFHDLQNDCAFVLSKSIESLMVAVDSETLDQPFFEEGEFEPVFEEGVSELISELDQFGFSNERELLIERVIGFEIFTAKLWIVEEAQWKRELMTWSAFQQARQAGLSPNSLKELVPEYLPVVPVNASTGEPFFYDSEDEQMIFSTEE